MKKNVLGWTLHKSFKYSCILRKTFCELLKILIKKNLEKNYVMFVFFKFVKINVISQQTKNQKTSLAEFLNKRLA